MAVLYVCAIIFDHPGWAKHSIKRRKDAKEKSENMSKTKQVREDDAKILKKKKPFQ